MLQVSPDGTNRTMSMGQIPIHIRMVLEGVPLDALLTTRSEESAGAGASFGLLSRPRLVMAGVWLASFLSLSTSGLWWFGVHRLIPGLSGPAYRQTLPLASNRAIVFGREHTLPAAPAAVLAPLAGNRVIVPSLDLNLPLVRAASLSDTHIQEALTEGVALFPNGVDPGMQGNTVVTAHSTGEPWKGQFRFAFLRIDRLNPGDTIFVDYGTRRHTYRVTGRRIIDPRATPALSSETPRALLTLTTCWPLWTTDQRLLVEAELVDSGPQPDRGSSRG